MRYIIIFLFFTTGVYSQNLRFDLNQFIKDTDKGRVLMSSLSDSSMTYDSGIRLTVDSLLLVYGDTILTTASTIIADGTVGGSSSGAIFQQVFIADGIDSSYTVDGELPINAKDLIVTRNGLVLDTAFIESLTTNTVTLTFLPNAGNRINVIWFEVGRDTTWNKNVDDIYYTAGNVGIGTTSPTAKLDVRGIINQAGTGNVDNKFETTSSTGRIIQSLSNDVGSAFQQGVMGSNNSQTLFGRTDNNIAFMYTTTFATQNPSVLVLGTYNNQDLVLGTNNTERLTIKNSGNVGIGTDSPNYRTHVAASATNGDVTTARQLGIGVDNNPNYNLTLGYYFTGSAYAGVLQARDNGNGSSLLLNPSGGNVGIGTTSPDKLLHLSGENTAYIRLENNKSSQNINDIIGGIDFKSNDISAGDPDVIASFEVVNRGINSSYGNRPNFVWSLYNPSGQTFNEIMTIDYTGNVGIGTQTPSAKLDVAGGSNAVGNTNLKISSDIYPWIDFYSANTNTDNRNWRIAGVSSAYGTFEILNSSAANGIPDQTRFAITKDGNVGIGTTSPSALLDVVGGQIWVRSQTNDSTPRLKLIGNTATGDGEIDGGMGGYNLLFKTNGSEKMRIKANGNVGIATTSPSYTLHVNGSVAGVGGYVNLSDIDYKKNIYDLTDGLDKVLQLRPVTFNWKNIDYGDRINTGFIAQEVELVLPDVVLNAQDGVKSLATTDLIPLLTKAIQELYTIIEQQQQTINELKATINE